MIIGEFGLGKSMFLYLIGFLDRLDVGEIVLNGEIIIIFDDIGCVVW